MKHKITLGVAIIARDEEANISRCLRSVQNICEQIVVVDTGSADNTPILAAKYGANVFFRKWRNDFADARNFAIRHLWTDWILCIDADEELTINDWQTVADKYLLKQNVGGISVILNNFLDEKLETAKQHRFTRLFKNDHRIAFTGKVHEQVAEQITQAGYEIIESDIIINHYGYIEQNMADGISNLSAPSRKQLRNKQLLEEEAKNGNDDYVQFHLANTELSMGNDATALEIFQKIAGSNSLSALQQEEIKIKIGQIYLKQNKFDAAINCLNFIASNNDNEGLRLSIIGAAYLHKQDFEKAKEIYSRSEVLSSKLVNIDIIEKAKQVFSILNV